MPQLPMWRCAAHCCLHYCGLSSGKQGVCSCLSPFIITITAGGSSYPFFLKKRVHRSLGEDFCPEKQAKLVDPIWVLVQGDGCEPLLPQPSYISTRKRWDALCFILLSSQAKQPTCVSYNKSFLLTVVFLTIPYPVRSSAAVNQR